ncbi:MAG: hypothetical protein IJZ32_00210 [Clostridia bacterium]|nr:hypothetical protein [Clostridia bacterium]
MDMKRVFLTVTAFLFICTVAIVLLGSVYVKHRSATPTFAVKKIERRIDKRILPYFAP